MRKVSRDFIALRQPRAKYTMMVIQGVDRSRIYEGETDPYDNVMREVRGHPDIFVCSGWLVGPYNEALDRTMIIPWWWNVEVLDQGRSFRHYDITPYAESDIRFEYIVDRDIVDYVKNDPLGLLTSVIPDPIEYSGGVFSSVDIEKSEKTALGDLSLGSIYYSQKRNILTFEPSQKLEISSGCDGEMPHGNIILDI